MRSILYRIGYARGVYSGRLYLLQYTSMSKFFAYRRLQLKTAIIYRIDY